jgi:hypothetical protein
MMTDMEKEAFAFWADQKTEILSDRPSSQDFLRRLAMMIIKEVPKIARDEHERRSRKIT